MCSMVAFFVAIIFNSSDFKDFKENQNVIISTFVGVMMLLTSKLGVNIKYQL